MERLAAESVPGLTADNADPKQLVLELNDPEGAATGDDAPHAAKAVIDAVVRDLNGFGRLRWGQMFDGISASQAVKAVGPAGDVTQRVFLGTAVDHMEPEDFADMVERLGHPRPPLPTGLEVIRALNGSDVTALVETNPEVGRVLHLVDLMLRDDEDIDWVAAYSALEIIEQDLRARGESGPDLGWWTKAERNDFTATANSVEVLGVRARHGKRFGLTEARMTTKHASWFIRRAAAHWVTHLQGETAEARSARTHL